MSDGNVYILIGVPFMIGGFYLASLYTNVNLIIFAIPSTMAGVFGTIYTAFGIYINEYYGK
jgi:hypothetical protein